MVISVRHLYAHASQTEPVIELARSYRPSDQDLKHVLQLVVDHEQEIRDAWRHHFYR